MYIYTCVCIHEYTHAYVCAHIHVCSTCVYTRVCVHVYISTSVYAQAIQENQLLNSWRVVLQ